MLPYRWSATTGGSAVLARCFPKGYDWSNDRSCVKVSLALELAASLTGQAQLLALDMLQQCPREGGMYTSP